MNFNVFKKLRKEHQILFFVLIFILLVLIFMPRQKPIFALGVSARVGNLKGNVGVETFDPSRLPESNEILTVAKEKKCFVMFYAPWCGWSKKAIPHFTKLANENQSDVHIAAVNCDENSDLSKTHDIQGFPTFKYFPTGMNNKGEDYTGDRDFDSMVQFLRNK